MVKHFTPGTEVENRTMSRPALDIILTILSLALLVLSVAYAKERIIFSDTAAYMFDVVRTGNVVVPTNRFISIISQLLPIAGVSLGLSLYTVVVLYSINLILIPVLSAALVRIVFKQAHLALAILLFYIVMGSNLFYYPVSEFQMGLCLLLVYHGLLLAFKNGRVHPVLYYLSGATLLVFVTFSHPMCLPVFIAWLIWVVLTEPSVKIKDLVFPLCVVLLSYYIKEHYFKAMIGNEAFDETRAAGLKNFGGTVVGYFDNRMAQTSLKSIWGDHFIAVFFLVFSLAYLLWQKKWLIASALAGICLGFWLLVTVSFKDSGYDHYYEHLYQPLPLFISLAFACYGIKLLRKEYLRIAFLAVGLVFSLAKINGAHIYNARRLTWFQNYFGLMDKLHLRKAGVGHACITVGNWDGYWSAPHESMLLSSLNEADSSRAMFVTVNFTSYQQETSQTRDLVLSKGYTVPINDLNPRYFRLDITKTYGVLDSLVNKTVLDSLSNVH